MSQDVLTMALRYAAAGRPVFPVGPLGKRPIVPNGLHDATTDPARIHDWYARWPNSGVAIRTGAGSRLVVVDVDGDDGRESLRELERQHGPLPTTASVVTPRGGAHLYFRHPGREIRNSAGKLGFGLDIRGDGGYVVAPPSCGANGRRYEVDESVSLAALPVWLLERLTVREAGDQRAPASEWMKIIAGVEAGQRNAQLTRLCGHLLRRFVDVDVTAELVHLVNAHRCRPPLDREEVDKLIDSIAEAEARRRERTAA